jgi:catechol-2,3-dioxygenase
MIAIQGLAEIVLMVADVDRSRRFYQESLGLKVISPDLGGPVFFQVGEGDGVPQQIVLIPRPPTAPAQPQDRAARAFHHLGIVVPRGSLADARKQLEALGLEVRTGEHPFLQVDAIYIDDPDGNEVELVAAR